MEEKNYENELVATENTENDVCDCGIEAPIEVIISTSSSSGKFKFGVAVGVGITLLGIFIKDKAIPWINKQKAKAEQKKAEKKQVRMFRKGLADAAARHDSAVVDEELEYFESTEESEK